MSFERKKSQGLPLKIRPDAEEGAGYEREKD